MELKEDIARCDHSFWYPENPLSELPMEVENIGEPESWFGLVLASVAMTTEDLELLPSRMLLSLTLPDALLSSFRSSVFVSNSLLAALDKPAKSGVCRIFSKSCFKAYARTGHHYELASLLYAM